jgi:fatty acid desaturase
MEFKTRISSITFAVKLLVLATLLCVGAFLALQNSLLLNLVGAIILGVMFAHAVELQHQCLHATAFRSKEWNLWIGRILGIPLFVSFAHYRARHFEHHSCLGTPKDREFFSYRNEEAKPLWTAMKSWLRLDRFRLCILDGARARLGRVPSDISTPRDRRLASKEYRFLLIFFLLLALLGLLFPKEVLFLWVLPALVVGEVTHILIELPEHYAVDTLSSNPLVNTRSITGSFFSYWLTNGNNFHVEHHLYPHLSIDQLPLVHRSIRAEIEALDPTYWAFFKKVLKGAN